MLRHLATQRLDQPCLVIRFSPSGNLALTCAAHSDEVTIWRITATGLDRISSFRTSEPDSRFRDAAWVSESAVALCGLYGPFQLWEDITTSPKVACILRDVNSPGEPTAFYQLYPLLQRGLLAVNTARSGIVILQSPNCRTLARDLMGGGTTSISLPERLVAGTFVDQAATTMMFGLLNDITEQAEIATSVDWLPVKLIQPGLLHGVMLDAARGMGVVFDGLQGAGCVTFRLPDFAVVARYNFEAAVAAGSVWPEEYEEFLAYDEALLCRPRLHQGNVIYPGLSGTVMLIEDVFGSGIAHPLIHHTRAITSTDVSDRLIAFASFDSTISLWDAQSLPVAPLPPTQSPGFDQWASFLATMREAHDLKPQQKLVRRLNEIEWRVHDW